MNGEGGGWTAHRATLHTSHAAAPARPRRTAGLAGESTRTGVRVWNPFHG